MMLRGRQVREMLKGRVEPEVLKVLESLAEEQFQVNKACIETTKMVEQMIKIMDDMTNVTANLKGQVIELKGRATSGEDEKYDS